MNRCPAASFPRRGDQDPITCLPFPPSTEAGATVEPNAALFLREQTALAETLEVQKQKQEEKPELAVLNQGDAHSLKRGFKKNQNTRWVS